LVLNWFLLPCQHLFHLPNTSSYTNNLGHIRCTCTLYPECSSSYDDRRWALPPASKRKGSGASALNLHPLSTSPSCPACSQHAAAGTQHGESQRRIENSNLPVPFTWTHPWHCSATSTDPARGWELAS
jgi:hypothetical protein